jgi:2EXR family
MPPSLNMFPLFSSLPLEIRQKIWFYSLPGPRTILITPNPNSLPGKTARGTHLGSESKYVAAPASYGGHQPAILSVNRESRAEARRYLTPLFDTYWNLDIDAPYFELPQGDNSKEEVMLPRAMREAGELDMFKHIAIDWFIWHWEDATRTMEFQRTFGRRLNYFEHP